VDTSSVPANFRLQDVFVNGTDNSVPVMLSVMPNVIEKSERTVVMHGGIVSSLDHLSNLAIKKPDREKDYVLIAEGTRYDSLFALFKFQR
jgi:hypothetical protein